MRVEKTDYYSLFQDKAASASKEDNSAQTKVPQRGAHSAVTPQDIVTITIDEKQILKKEEDRQKQIQEARELDNYQKMLESSRAQTKSAGEAARIRMKCMLIASRIMSGNKVPKKDYQYLAKNDPELYGKALTMRIKRENPKKYKAVSEEEEAKENTTSSDTTSTEELSTEESTAAAPEGSSEEM